MRVNGSFQVYRMCCGIYIFTLFPSFLFPHRPSPPSLPPSLPPFLPPSHHELGDEVVVPVVLQHVVEPDHVRVLVLMEKREGGRKGGREGGREGGQ